MSCCLVNLQITSPQGTSPWHRRMIKPGCFTHKIHEAESFSFSGQLWLISLENPKVCKHWCPATEDLVAQVSGSEAWGLNSLKLLIRAGCKVKLALYETSKHFECGRCPCNKKNMLSYCIHKNFSFSTKPSCSRCFHLLPARWIAIITATRDLGQK